MGIEPPTFKQVIPLRLSETILSSGPSQLGPETTAYPELPTLKDFFCEKVKFKKNYAHKVFESQEVESDLIRTINRPYTYPYKRPKSELLSGNSLNHAEYLLRMAKKSAHKLGTLYGRVDAPS